MNALSEYRRIVTIAALCTGLLGPPAPAYAQDQGEKEERCWFFCAPELKIEPTITFEPIFRRPVIQELENGEVVADTRPDRETVFEIILSLGIPTTIPRVGFTFETIFIPFGETDENPFTGSMAPSDRPDVNPRQRDRGGVRAKPRPDRAGADGRLGGVPLRHRGQVQPRRTAGRRQRLHAQAELRVGHPRSSSSTGSPRNTTSGTSRSRARSTTSPPACSVPATSSAPSAS